MKIKQIMYIFYKTIWTLKLLENQSHVSNQVFDSQFEVDIIKLHTNSGTVRSFNEFPSW